MNALYAHALRQTQSITADLSLLETSLRPIIGNGEGTSYSAPTSMYGNAVDTTGLNGQIVASLAALQRTVDDYENMARRELVEANKGKTAKSVIPLMKEVIASRARLILSVHYYKPRGTDTERLYRTEEAVRQSQADPGETGKNKRERERCAYGQG